MLALITTLFVAVAAIAGVVEYWFWLQRRRGADAGAENSTPRPERAISLATESLAAAGAILVLAGSGVAISQHWLLVTDGGRVGILAGVALSFLVAGFLVRWLTASSSQPLTELTWCASAGCVAGAAAIAAAALYRQPVPVTVVLTGGSLALYCAALWLLCRREMLMFAALAGLIGAFCGAIAVLVAYGPLWLIVALGLWLIGIAWVILGLLYPEPLGTSLTVGVAIALAAPAVAVHDRGWIYAVAIATGVAAMAVSVPLRNVVVAAFGSCALFGYITAVVLRYADRSLGVPASLVIIGLVLIGLALVTVLLGRASRPGPPPPKTARPGRDHKRTGRAVRRQVRAA
jgi:hypothetical protein